MNKRPRWIDTDIVIKHSNVDEFEEWCANHKIRFNWALVDNIHTGRPVPRRGGPKAWYSRVDRIYRVWSKWPDMVMMCKLTWAGR